MAIDSSVEKAVESFKRAQPLGSCASLPTIAAPPLLVTTYLEMTDWSQFRPAYLNYLDGIKVMCMDTPDVAFYRFLYTAIGKHWRWYDRLSHSDAELEALLAAPGTSVHVLYVEGSPAGYIELVQHQDGLSGRYHSTEVVYFGLRQSYTGRGLGKHLLSHGIAYAWNKGTQRLWAHTCNLDGPYALQNYVKRGFKVYRVDKQPMPERYL